LKIIFNFAGKTFRGGLSELVDDYFKRIQRYVPAEIIEVKSVKKHSREGVHVVLSPSGKMMSSEAFAKFIGDNLNNSTKHLFFYTGAPVGHEKEFEKDADLLLSFSKMTFNHQLIRVMLLEQVYRAFTIIRGEKYHK
jgi:23S rRNA (pseudouridine1915-N3)-methyltransferase